MEPRPAATVVVVRPAGPVNELEFLVLRRAGASRFAPGFVVFPGGVVEPEDPMPSSARHLRDFPEQLFAGGAVALPLN